MKTLQLTTLLCLFSIAIFAQISPQEKQALEDLYTATNGDNWKTSWNLNQPETSWEGVTIKNDKVVSISLLFNNLEGEIPSSINQLQNLEKLELSFNKIRGSLPVEIGDLTQLKVLAFNGNNLTGILPNSLGNLSSLTQLHLSSNQLSGEIPQSITQLEYLEILNVFDNNMSGSIPAELAYSRNLKQLLVAENNFNDTQLFSQEVLSQGGSVELEQPYVIPTTKEVIAIETEEEN